MPFPLLAPLITAGASLLGGAADAFSTGRQNRRSMDFSREMYQRQYNDNLNLWKLQNEYNSPQAQMKRFQQAGLNPHLIYGQGNSGNAGNIPTPDVQSPQFRSPDIGGSIAGAGLNFINSIYDLDIKAAQADNLRSQNTVIQQDALLRAAQIKQVSGQAARAAFDLDFETELRSTSADARREAVRQMRTGTDIALRQDVRNAISSATSVREANERIVSMVEQRRAFQLQRAHTKADIARVNAETARIRQNISLMQKEGIMKQLDVQFAQEGIRPGDPLWYRTVTQLYNSVLNLFKDE